MGQNRPQLDKIFKLKTICLELQENNDDYFVMLMDADDLVSNKLIEYVDKGQDKYGYYIYKGYELDYVTKRLRYCPCYNRGRLTMLLGFFGWMGSLSFAIYCLHVPFLFLLGKSASLGHPMAQFLFYFALVLIMSWLLAVLSRKITVFCFFGSKPVETHDSESGS